MIAFHKERKAAVTLTLVRVADPLEYGVVITDQHGRITKFLEKPSWGEVFSDTINTGIYVIEPRVLQRYAIGEAFDFSKDLFPQLLAEGEPLYGYVADGYWTDVGSIGEYSRANADLLRGKMSGTSLGMGTGAGTTTEGGRGGSGGGTHRGGGQPHSAAGGDLGRDLLVSEHRGGGTHHHPDHPDGHSDCARRAD